MNYEGERCPICHGIGLDEQPIEHRESYPTIKRRGKRTRKFLGILVVIVVGLIAVPVGMTFLGHQTSPETPQRTIQEDTMGDTSDTPPPIILCKPCPSEPATGKAIEYDTATNSITIDGKSLEGQTPEIIPEEANILDDGILTYKMDPIPYYTSKETDFIKEAVYDGFNAWSQLNPKLVFSEISVGDPDIQISWIDFRGTHVGTGCLNCLHDGATIEVVLEQRDCNGKLVQYDKDMITFTVAHEFGHNLGLGHNADENHLMWSIDHPQIPYDTLGYNIPKLPSGNIVGYKELNDKYNLLGEYLNVSGKELDLLETEYSQIPEEVSSDEEYQRAVQMHDKINTKVDDFNNMIELQNQYVEMMNCLLEDNITYKDNHGVLTIIIPKKEMIITEY